MIDIQEIKHARINAAERFLYDTLFELRTIDNGRYSIFLIDNKRIFVYDKLKHKLHYSYFYISRKIESELRYPFHYTKKLVSDMFSTHFNIKIDSVISEFTLYQFVDENANNTLK